MGDADRAALSGGIPAAPANGGTPRPDIPTIDEVLAKIIARHEDVALDKTRYRPVAAMVLEIALAIADRLAAPATQDVGIRLASLEEKLSGIELRTRHPQWSADEFEAVRSRLGALEEGTRVPPAFGAIIDRIAALEAEMKRRRGGRPRKEPDAG